MRESPHLHPRSIAASLLSINPRRSNTATNGQPTTRERPMELLVILIVGSPIVFAIWVAVRLVGDRSQINSLKSQVERLEEQFARLPHGAAPTSPPEPATTDAAQTGASAPIEPSVHAAEPIFSEPPVTPPPPEPIAVPPPLPVMASVASIDAVPAAEASKPAASAPPAPTRTPSSQARSSATARGLPGSPRVRSRARSAVPKSPRHRSPAKKSPPIPC